MVIRPLHIIFTVMYQFKIPSDGRLSQLCLTNILMGSFLMRCQRILFYSVMLLCFSARISYSMSSDGEALLSFKTSIVASDGIFLQWRQEDSDPCKWKGVTCETHTKRVIYLSLANHKIIGSLVPEIGKLNQLKLLSLHGNSLYGTIPQELGNCTNLRHLYLQGNYLSGTIPSEIGNILALETLDISSNALSGSIPPSLANLSKLNSFNASMNFLTGAIPSDGAFFRLTENSFVGNHDLCGKQAGAECKDGNLPPLMNFPYPEKHPDPSIIPRNCQWNYTNDQRCDQQCKALGYHFGRGHNLCAKCPQQICCCDAQS